MDEDGRVETSISFIWLDENGIVWVKNKPGADHDLAAAQGNVAVMAELTSNKPACQLIDIRGDVHVSREARQYYAGPEASAVTKARAILIGSGVSRAIGNFFMGLNRPPEPTRLFTDESAALAWLAEFK